MASHTTTGEWQSFEVRMRRRRAERLIHRAETAVEAGSLEDARLCLSEARSLAPDLPALDALEQRLSPSEAVPIPNRSRRAAAAAAVALVVATIALVAAWPMLSRSTATPSESVQAATEVPVTPPASDAPPSPAQPDSAPLPAAAVAPEAATTSPADTGLVTAAPQPVQADAVEPAATAIARDPEVPRIPVIDALPLPESMPGRVTVPLPPPVFGPATTPVGALGLSVVTETPAPVPPPQPSEEPAVRSVLDRYASAYSALDVDAAQQVWPGVNRVALARAFDNLASQEVSLGNCRIDVAAASATAQCVGTTSWAPKIGDGGRHRETRQWTFELTRAGSGWQIVTARVQNR